MSISQRTYCATLIPDSTLAEDAESLADAGLLPIHHIQAASAEQAQVQAHRATGLRVLKTERIAEVA